MLGPPAGPTEAEQVVITTYLAHRACPMAARVLIATHGPCTDGLAASAVVETAVLSKGHACTCVSLDHSSPSQAEVEEWLRTQARPGDILAYFDICPTDEVLALWESTEGVQLIVGDHHDSQRVRMREHEARLKMQDATAPRFQLLWGDQGRPATSGVSLAVAACYHNAVPLLAAARHEGDEDMLLALDSSAASVAQADTSDMQDGFAAYASDLSTRADMWRALTSSGTDRVHCVERGAEIQRQRVEGVVPDILATRVPIGPPGAPWLYLQCDSGLYLKAATNAVFGLADSKVSLALFRMKHGVYVSVRSAPGATLTALAFCATMAGRLGNLHVATHGGHEAAAGITFCSAASLETALAALASWHDLIPKAE